MFFVGVQLDITAPPTPKAIAALQAAPAGNAAVTGDSAAGVPANAGAEEQTGILRSPAASQQVQSQVWALYQYLFLYQCTSMATRKAAHACSSAPASCTSGKVSSVLDCMSLR